MPVARAGLLAHHQGPPQIKKEFILPLIFTKRLCDVFDDELNCIAQEVGSRAKLVSWT